MPSKVSLILCSFLLPILIITILPNIAFPTASYIIAGRYVGVTCCGNVTNITCNDTASPTPENTGSLPCPNGTCTEPLMTLSTWLYVTASTGLAFCVVGVTIVLVACITLMISTEDGGLITVGVMALFYFIIMIVFSLFVLAWNIVGAVVLFRDNENCLSSNPPVWAMTLANLIIMWLSLLAYFLKTIRGHKHADDN